MFFVVLSSAIIRPNSNFHVVVDTYEGQEARQLKVSIQGENYSQQKIVEAQPNTSQLINFEIPDIERSDYEIEIENLELATNEESEEETKFSEFLVYERPRNLILIQTDKALYKPGDLLKFRVFILDYRTRPIKGETSAVVSIYDAKQNRIKQIKDVTLLYGIFEGEFQISKFPILGCWKIEVLEGDLRETISFDVDKYVLPKFEVFVEIPEHVFASKEEKVKGFVKAMYSFGKPVKGEFTVFLNEVNLKTIFPLNGTAQFELNFEDILPILSNNENEELCTLETVVKEGLTGNERKANVSFKIHKKFAEMNVSQLTKWTQNNNKLIFEVCVTKYDGCPLQDDEISVIVVITPYIKLECLVYGEKHKMVETLNELGKAFFEFEASKTQYEDYIIKVNFLDMESRCHITKEFSDVKLMQPIQHDHSHDLSIRLHPKSPKVGEEICIEVTGIDFDRFSYILKGSEDILQSEQIELRYGEHECKISLKVTWDMFPSFVIVVFFIKEGVFRHAEEKVLIKTLNNFVKLNAPNESKIGDTLNISIKTKPNSYVGLLGVDKSVKLLGDNDLHFEHISNKLVREDSTIETYPIRNGIKFITNIPAKYSKVRKLCRRLGPCQELTEMFTDVRKWFPEVWLWELISINKSGNIVLHKKIPDTITTWVLTAFTIHPEYGLGVTNNSTDITAFKSFFVACNLPYSVKRGEIIALSINIFNYLNEISDTVVTLDNAEAEFEFIDISENGKQDISLDLRRMKKLQIDKNSAASIVFHVRPKRIGEMKIKVNAIAPGAKDAIQDVLRVESEGKTEYKEKTVLFNLTDKQEYSENVEIEVPENAVPDSTFIQVSIFGNVLALVCENLDQLIQKPCGCGEQNMIYFVPNILVFKYLRNIGKLSIETEAKIMNHLYIGYQNELKYHRSDGSFSAFGESDDNGSTWLTAYVVQSFCQARDLIEIDDNVLQSAVSYLIKKQTKEGYFKDDGFLFDNFGESVTGISLTAFTLIALLECKEKLTNPTPINKALDYLERNIESESGIYPLSIATYAFQQANHIGKDALFSKLIKSAKRNDDKMWWSNSKEESENFESNNTDVEITSYASLVLLENVSNDREKISILKWLLSQMNGSGGFKSTQDTVLGLRAMIKFSEIYAMSSSEKITVNYRDDKGVECRSVIDCADPLFFESYEISPLARRITLTGKGSGLVEAVISYRFNSYVCEEKPRFKLEFKICKKELPDVLKLCIFSSFIPQQDELTSNMAVLEINLPSGYICDSDCSSNLKKVDAIKLVETAKADSLIIIYFDKLSTQTICSEIRAFRLHEIFDQKQAHIVIYDYYDTSREAKAFYNLSDADN